METKIVKIGNKVIGGGNPILIQSMTNTKTENVADTVAHLRRLRNKSAYRLLRIYTLITSLQ